MKRSKITKSKRKSYWRYNRNFYAKIIRYWCKDLKINAKVTKYWVVKGRAELG